MNINDIGKSPPLNPDFHHSTNGSGFGFQPAGPTPLGGGVHDSFNVDKDGNVSNGHTTSQVPGGQKQRMNWP